MSSNYYGGQAGELADTHSLMPPGVDAGYCEDGHHECGGYCGNCGIHLDEHGTKCGEYADGRCDKALDTPAEVCPKCFRIHGEDSR